MNRRLLIALGSAALLLGTILPGASLAASPKVVDGPQRFTKDGIYIVQLRELPTVAYDGKTAGFAKTKPAKGHKLDPSSAAAVRYSNHLKAKHDAELKAHGGKKIYDYTTSNNGFAARLTAAQANKMAADKDVVAVVPDELRTMDTSSTPAFLGLSAPGGLWDQLGGVGKAGENIIIGDIDSGIWPEAQSFSDRVGKNPASNGLTYKKPAGWTGICQTGEDWNKHDCNNKLIGARYYNASFGGNAGINADRPWEFNSPRDYNGHGTHTASTAGGNSGIQATGAAAAFGKISGMAPRARISVYKALWSTQDASTASGSTSDLVAAIDQAVADGVDVINYSISGTSTNFLDPVEVSFLFAANAGIFVSESAGNDGPTVSTVAHPGPWTTTVAAGTHNRDGQGSVTLGNGTTYNGASVATPVGPAPLIDSTAAGVSGANATSLALCFSTATNGGTPVLDPAKVAGKIVVCDRGVSGRTDKSLAVQEAGGVGMILLNTSPNSLNADFHFVPTVHVADTSRTAIKAYAATAGATATINAATIVFNAPAPLTATFSSRGPLLAGGGDLLKPDVIAPGQDILAAVAPPGNHGLDFNLLSGTSMSAPHVAGVAALLKNLHPTWSPMAIKSALMTSAGDVLDGPNTSPTVIFRQGAGHIAPNSAADPGLVYDSNINDWLAFLCGATPGAVSPDDCADLASAGFLSDTSDFNGASIAIGDLAGVQTITRRVTNVGSSAATYTASVAGLAGVNAVVSPSSLTLNPGQTKSYTVAFTRGTAALNAYVGGQLTWTDGTHNVRSPLVIKPVALAAPATVSGDGGPISYDVKFGYTGEFTATARGLIPAQTFTGSVGTDPDGVFAPVADANTIKFDIAVPAGTTIARFALFDDAVAPASDLDLYVYNGATRVGVSGGGSAEEQVDLLNPTATTYSVYVHGFDTGDPSTFTLFAWTLGTADAGNMTVSAPASATLGQTDSIDLTFSGLAAGTRYLGSVVYGGASGMPNPTIVRVDTP